MAPPRGGWLRAIRRAIGMTAADMAAALDVAPSNVVRLEQSEQKGTIRLDSLRRAADVLGCDVAYVLVPRESLEAAVERQRRSVGRALNAKVHTHMQLEGQDTDDPSLDRWREERAAALVSDRQLWKKIK